MVELGPRAKFVVFFLRCYWKPNLDAPCGTSSVYPIRSTFHFGRALSRTSAAHSESFWPRW